MGRREAEGQRRLPFAGAAASLAERRNMLGLALMRVDCSCHLSVFVQLVFDATEDRTAAQLVRTYEQLRHAPWGLCCSARTVQRTVAEAEKLGLVAVDENGRSDCGQTANGYSIHWDGVRALLDLERAVDESPPARSRPQPTNEPRQNDEGPRQNVQGPRQNVQGPRQNVHPPQPDSDEDVPTIRARALTSTSTSNVTSNVPIKKDLWSSDVRRQTSDVGRDVDDQMDVCVLDGDVDVDWDEMREHANRIVRKIFPGRCPRLSRADRSLLLKACLLSRTTMSEEWLNDSVEAVVQTTNQKPLAYLHAVLTNKCNDAGLKLNRLLATISVPKHFLEPRAP